METDTTQAGQTTHPAPQTHENPGLRQLDQAVKKVILFGEDGTPRARRAHPADRVTDNRQDFLKKFKGALGRPATHFTEAER